MSLFSISQERIDLTKAKFDFAREVRRATRVRHALDAITLKLPKFLLGRDPFAFSVRRFVEAHPDSALARSRETLLAAAERYAEFRASIARSAPDAVRKSVELRAKLEIAHALRLARQSLYERALGSSVRFLFGGKIRATASAAAIAAFLFLTPPGKAAITKIGSLYTKDLFASFLYGGARAGGVYAPYAVERVLDVAGVHRGEDLWEGADRIAKSRTFASDASAIAGVAGGFALREYFADALGNWLHLDSSSQIVRESIPNMRENLLHDIELKRGVPEYLPDAHERAHALETALQETALVADARRGSPLLQGLHERIALFYSGDSRLLDTPTNENLFADGLAHLKRLETLETARLRYESLGGDTASASDPAVLFLRKAVHDLVAERAAVKEWTGRFDAATNAALEQFRADHEKNLAELSGEYLLTGKAYAFALPHEALFHAPPHVHDLPLTHGDLSPESFHATADAALRRLSITDRILDRYQHVIGIHPNDHVYRALLASRARYAALAAELASLKPFFDHLSVIHSAISANAHYGEKLADALLEDRVRQVDFHSYDDAWPAVMAAESRVASIPSGHVFVDGAVVPLDDVLSFKSDTHYEGLSPFMGHALEKSLQKLEADGTHATVTEGFDLSYHAHISGCHTDGTCVDLAVPWTGRDLYNVFNDLGPTAERLILEGKTQAQTNHLRTLLKEYLVTEKHMSQRDANSWIHERTVIKKVPWATGPNFHFEPKNGATIPAPTAS